MRCSKFVSTTLCEESLINHAGSDRVPVYEVTLEASLERVLKTMLVTRSHRIWVVDSSRSLIGVVSMTDVLAKLHSLQIEC